MTKGGRTQAVFQDEDIPFAGTGELALLSAQMAGMARRQLDVVSRSLNPAIYDTEAFISAAKNLVLSHRGRIRLLVLDCPSLITRDGHRLVNMAMRLSSYMEIREPGPDHQDIDEAMLIVDGLGIIHQQHSDRHEGIANFRSPRQASRLAERFENLWQNANTNAYFRRLML